MNFTKIDVGSAQEWRWLEMMEWLPAPTNIRAELRVALEISDPAARLERLAALAQYRLSILEAIQLDRALGSFKAEPPPGYSNVRLALLANATVEHLVAPIRVAGLRHKLLFEVYTGAYGQYRQELLDSSSPLNQFAPQVVAFSLTADEAVAGIPVAALASEASEAIDRWLHALQGLWETARKSFRASVVQQTFLNTTDPLFGNFDRLVPGAPARLIAQLNDRLSDAAARCGVALLDVAGASERDGRDVWFDPVRWFQAKQQIALPAALAYANLLTRIVAAQRGLSRKCLVLDLDNTLWGGVIGDDGLGGIRLGQGTAVGEAHVALQRYAKQLKERGVILAVCSRNDPAIAEAAFRDHPEMVLERSDIAAFVASWEDKAESLKRIAERLNIGLDGLVFVDDNPVERARIRQALPMVAVPELPSDVSGYARCVADAGYFEAVSFTSDDRQRAAQYTANSARELLRESAQTVGEFLDTLEMVIDAREFAAVDLARITQLINKTNQFNLTTRRYSLEDVTALAADRDNVTLQLRLVDRYGDNGLVSAMILRPTPEQMGVLVIDTWVMSCRVFGRELEYEAMSIAVELARTRGARAIAGDYIATPRNDVVRELYPALGFVRLGSEAAPSGTQRWIIDLTDYKPRTTHIKRRARAND